MTQQREEHSGFEECEYSKFILISLRAQLSIYDLLKSN
jgi:hypothetical protein